MKITIGKIITFILFPITILFLILGKSKGGKKQNEKNIDKSVSRAVSMPDAKLRKRAKNLFR